MQINGNLTKIARIVAAKLHQHIAAPIQVTTWNMISTLT